MSIRIHVSIGSSYIDCMWSLTEIVADRNNDVHHEASIHAYREPQAGEHESNLVHIGPKSTRPAKANALLQDWSQRVDDAEYERQGDYVLVRKVQDHEMCRDDLPNAVRIDETDLKHKGYEVIV